MSKRISNQKLIERTRSRMALRRAAHDDKMADLLLQEVCDAKNKAVTSDVSALLAGMCQVGEEDSRNDAEH